MSKVLPVLPILIVIATFSIAFSQEPSRNNDTPPSQGIAPKVPNGIGRADVRVFDEKGNPIRNAYVKLESTRTDGFASARPQRIAAVRMPANANADGFTALPTCDGTGG